MMSVYLAGPIDLSDDVSNWRLMFKQNLQLEGVTAVCFDPSSAFLCPNWGTKMDLKRSRYIEDINTTALDYADIVVISIPRDKPSVGTPIELDHAYRNAKNIIVITDILPGQSAYLDNRVNEDNWCFYGKDLGSIEDAIQDAARCAIGIMESNKKIEEVLDDDIME